MFSVSTCTFDYMDVPSSPFFLHFAKLICILASVPGNYCKLPFLLNMQDIQIVLCSGSPALPGVVMCSIEKVPRHYHNLLL